MKTTFGEFVRFSLVGVVGFVVDTAVLYLAVLNFGLNPYWGRLVSYLVAATTTWNLNRKFTFKIEHSRSAHKQWIHYVLVNALGGGINYLVYVVCLHFFNLENYNLVIGVVAGSAAGLAFNFTTSKLWVFKADVNRA